MIEFKIHIGYDTYFKLYNYTLIHVLFYVFFIFMVLIVMSIILNKKKKTYSHWVIGRVM